MAQEPQWPQRALPKEVFDLQAFWAFLFPGAAEGMAGGTPEPTSRGLSLHLEI